MSTPYDPKILTRRTEKDFSSNAWFLVKPVADDDIDIATTGNVVIGALTNDVAAGSGTAPVYVPVQIGGVIKVMCGNTCTLGTYAMSDSNGEAVDVTGSQINAFGIALGTYANGQIGAFLWAPTYMDQT